MTTELWRPVVGWEDRYEVSSCGRVRSIRCSSSLGGTYLRIKPKIKAPTVRRDGRVQVNLVRDNVNSRHYVHHLVLNAFVEPRPPGMECGHLNGNPTDNRLTNLRWMSHHANMQQLDEHGTRIRGSAARGAKLTDESVLAARAMRQSGSTLQAIADLLRVSETTVRNAVNGKRWAHVQ